MKYWGQFELQKNNILVKKIKWLSKFGQFARTEVG